MRTDSIPVIISDNYLIDPDTDFHYAFIQGLPVYASYHKHDFFEVVLVTKGKMYHLIKEEKHLLHEGALLFIRPDDYHYYADADEDSCNFINLAFSADILNTLVSYLGGYIGTDFFLDPYYPPMTILKKEHTEFLKRRIDQLNTYFTKVEIKAEFRAIMADILASFLHEQYVDTEEDYPSWLQAFLTMMHKKEYFAGDISHLYESVDKSREHIARMFKRYLGQSPRDYLNDVRLNYAARNLLHSNNSIIDIAMESGFENLSHFYHLFKRKYGESPCRFRKSYQRIVVPEK
jgi:AraC family cel operon transcriptional repressor